MRIYSWLNRCHREVCGGHLEFPGFEVSTGVALRSTIFYISRPATGGGRSNGQVVQGARKLSQERAVRFWRDFEPSKRSFQWGAGVCGDLKQQRLQA